MEGSYRTQALLRKHIPKERGREPRPLSIPTVRDGVVHTATKHVIEPIFEKTFSETSFGFRPKRSNKDALRATVEALKSGKLYVVDTNISKCFDEIPHEPLLERIGEQISDSRTMTLIGDFLKHGIMEAGEQWEPQEGTPQGGPLSPLLANVYLNPVDWLMHEKGYTSVRFADDIVILCESEDALAALVHLREWMGENGLRLTPEKTRVVDMSKPKAYFEQVDGWVRMRLRSILRKCHKGRGRGGGFDQIRWPNAYFWELGLFSLVTARDSLRSSASR